MNTRTPLPLTFARLGAAAACLVSLSGCGAMFLGAAATTAMVATDRRSAGEQVDDKSIELKIGQEMRRAFPQDEVRINNHSYAGQVLLVGDVPNDSIRQQAQSVAGKVDKVRSVVNQLRVGEVTPLSVRTNDSWLSSKILTALISTRDVPTRTISITTERGVVYLQGKVTRDEGARAAKVTSQVSGVNRVVTLFQYVSPESLNDTMVPQDAPAAQPPQDTQAPAPIEDGGAQAMPVQ